MATLLTTPVGIMVQGHPLRPITKDMQGRPLTFSDGSPRQSFFLAIAVSKTNEKIKDFLDGVKEIANDEFPRLRGNLEFPSKNFAWKITDGDDPNESHKKGFAGCWVIKMSNSFCPEVVDLDSREDILSETGLKCGDYVRAVVSVKGNYNKEKPGVYMNVVSVGKIMDGDPIINKKSYIDFFKED